MDDIAHLIKSAQTGLLDHCGSHQFHSLLQNRRVPETVLVAMAGELYHLVRSDRRSFSLLASRFPSATAGDLFLAMAQGEGEALALLLDFAKALGRDEAYLRAYDTRAMAQAYPAYLTQTALYSSQSSVALALLANVGESGDQYRRVANTLQAHYGYSDKAVAHFRYFADTPQELIDMASATLREGLASGDDPTEAVRTARMVQAYESLFWSCLANDVELQ